MSSGTSGAGTTIQLSLSQESSSFMSSEHSYLCVTFIALKSSAPAVVRQQYLNVLPPVLSVLNQDEDLMARIFLKLMYLISVPNICI